MRPLQQFAQASRGRETERERARENFRAARCARAARANTNSVACAAPEQNRLMPIPESTHKGERSLAQSKCQSILSSIDTHRYKNLFHVARRELFSHWVRAGRRRGCPGIFDFLSLLLTQSVNTLSVMYHGKQLLVFVCGLLSAAHTRLSQTKDRQTRIMCAVKRCFCNSTSSRLELDGTRSLDIMRNVQSHTECQWSGSFSQMSANRVRGGKSL